VDNQTLASYQAGEINFFRCKNGAMGFSWLMSISPVSWSGSGATDLLLGTNGRNIVLAPAKDHCYSDMDGNGSSVEADFYSMCVNVCAHDIDGDGRDELVIGGPEGVLYFARMEGDYPNLSIETRDPVRDRTHGLPFSILSDSPHYEFNDEGGYLDPQFFYIYPTVYPDATGSGRVNLIVGDYSGLLWWMQDRKSGTGMPEYDGVKVEKDPDKYRHAKAYSRAAVMYRKFGTHYANPSDKIVDENGDAICLGHCIRFGAEPRKGFTSKPYAFLNESTGRHDLVVFAQDSGVALHHLSRINDNAEDKPIFRNMGRVEIRDFDENRIRWHACAAWIEARNQFLIAHDHTQISIFTPSFDGTGRLVLTYDQTLTSPMAVADGYMFSALLHDTIRGRRYLLDSAGGGGFNIRLIHEKQDGDEEDTYLSTEKIPFMVDSRKLYVKGYTDPFAWETWGFDRFVKWDYDGKRKQHLVGGLDSGRIMLLIENDDNFREQDTTSYTNAGCLKDQNGNEIKIFNRASACGIDLSGNGVEDLLIGGISYQNGNKYDEIKGQGICVCRNLGLDNRGLPVLDAPQMLDLDLLGIHLIPSSHVHMMSVDMDGEKVVVISVESDGYLPRIFKVDRENATVFGTGEIVADVNMFSSYLLDMDGDGCPEFVHGGNEDGRASFRKLTRTNRAE
jgi:hypothetical protein